MSNSDWNADPKSMVLVGSIILPEMFQNEGVRLLNAYHVVIRISVIAFPTAIAICLL